MEDYMFENSVNTLIHKLVHVLAVGSRNFNRFLDPETGEIIENAVEFNKFCFCKSLKELWKLMEI